MKMNICLIYTKCAKILEICILCILYFPCNVLNSALKRYLDKSTAFDNTVVNIQYARGKANIKVMKISVYSYCDI